MLSERRRRSAEHHLDSPDHRHNTPAGDRLGRCPTRIDQQACIQLCSQLSCCQLDMQDSTHALTAVADAVKAWVSQVQSTGAASPLTAPPSTTFPHTDNIFIPRRSKRLSSQTQDVGTPMAAQVHFSARASSAVFKSPLTAQVHHPLCDSRDRAGRLCKQTHLPRWRRGSRHWRRCNGRPRRHGRRMRLPPACRQQACRHHCKQRRSVRRLPTALAPARRSTSASQLRPPGSAARNDGAEQCASVALCPGYAICQTLHTQACQDPAEATGDMW